MKQQNLAVAVGAALAMSFSSAAVMAAPSFVDSKAAPGTERVIVAFQDGHGPAGRNAVKAAGGSIALDLAENNAVAAYMPSAAIKGLQNNPHVAFVEADAPRYPLSLTSPSTGNPYAAGQLVPYGIPMVQADQMPNGDQFTGNRKLCIIDSGYDGGQEDLAHTANVTGEYDSGTGWWYVDDNHHGTHVAGTISALNNAGTGVVGVNSNNNIKLHIVKVFDAAGWAYSSSLITATNKCKAAGANVISMSLGGSLKSKSEDNQFKSLATAGILSIAAAGNDGNTRSSYPASYASVMSVAAVDENAQWASFSQYNTAVDISGPGVGVLSTVPMGAGSISTATIGGTGYTVGDMEGSPQASASGALFDFGLGDAVNSAAAGKVCLIARGTIDFATKVSNCQASGGVGAIVYNNVAGGFGGTLGTTVTSIPSVTASDTDGAAMLGQIGQSATVAVQSWNYAYYDGTSMATPHVSAVAALVWSYFPSCTGNQIKASLEKSALDLDVAGRDNKTGYGLVQARSAYNRIASLGCGN